MTAYPSALERLEARLEAQSTRIDELYRLLKAVSAQQSPEPRRLPRRRHGRAAAVPRR